MFKKKFVCLMTTLIMLLTFSTSAVAYSNYWNTKTHEGQEYGYPGNFDPLQLTDETHWKVVAAQPIQWFIFVVGLKTVLKNLNPNEEIQYAAVIYWLPKEGTASGGPEQIARYGYIFANEGRSYLWSKENSRFEPEPQQEAGLMKFLSMVFNLKQA